MLKKRKPNVKVEQILKKIQDETRKNFRVYVSGALTGLNSENSCMKEFYEGIAKVVDEVLGPDTAYVPHKHTDPIKHPNVTPEEVYQIDSERVCESDLIIAYIGAASTGTGIELGIAKCHGIPILLLYMKGETVSRLPKGMVSKTNICEYTSEEQALNWVKQKIKEMFSQKK